MDPTDRQEVLQGPHVWDNLSSRAIVRFSTFLVLQQQLCRINGLLPYRLWANRFHSVAAVTFFLSRR
jgi:hypothetical protein